MTDGPAAPQKKGLSTPIVILIVVAALFGACSCFGILAAIAIPNFVRFQARAKQNECMTLLKSAYTAEKIYFAENDQFSENTEQLQLTPDGKRAVLVFGPSAAPVGSGPDAETLAAAIAAHINGHLGVTGKCPDCSVTIGCAANVDSDPEIDVWSISTDDRTSARGQRIPAGIPYNDYNDLLDAPGE